MLMDGLLSGSGATRSRAARTPTAPVSQAATMRQHALKDKQEILRKIGGHQFNQCVLDSMSEDDTNAA